MENEYYAILIEFTQGTTPCKDHLIHRYGEELLDACLTEGYIVPDGTNSAGDTKYRITPAGRAKRDD